VFLQLSFSFRKPGLAACRLRQEDGRFQSGDANRQASAPGAYSVGPWLNRIVIGRVWKRRVVEPDGRIAGYPPEIGDFDIKMVSLDGDDMLVWEVQPLGTAGCSPKIRASRVASLEQTGLLEVLSNGVSSTCSLPQPEFWADP
jgi:hypothetical protein